MTSRGSLRAGHPGGGSEGARRIAAERQRQFESERWTPIHDDAHVQHELALAAAVYALPHRVREQNVFGRTVVACIWPRTWSRDYFKPTPDDRIRELVKAGALCAAEIDRLLRKETGT